MTKSTRVAAITEVLRSVYGKGAMVTALAEDLDDRWPAWEAGEGDARWGMEYAVHMQIWNWFSGGGTAEIAARRVIEAVGREQG